MQRHRPGGHRRVLLLAVVPGIAADALPARIGVAADACHAQHGDAQHNAPRAENEAPVGPVDPQIHDPGGPGGLHELGQTFQKQEKDREKKEREFPAEIAEDQFHFGSFAAEAADIGNVCADTAIIARPGRGCKRYAFQAAENAVR